MDYLQKLRTLFIILIQGGRIEHTRGQILEILNQMIEDDDFFFNHWSMPSNSKIFHFMTVWAELYRDALEMPEVFQSTLEHHEEDAIEIFQLASSEEEE